MPATSPSAARPARRRPVLRAALCVWALLALVAFATASGPADPVAGQDPGNACAEVDTFIDIAGSPSARPAFNVWGTGICDAGDVVAAYAASSSKDGRAELIEGSAAISLSTLPFTEAEGEELEAAERGVVQVPIIATAAVCTYWDQSESNPQYPRGKGYPDLRLSRRTVGRLLGGADIATDDAGLAEDNAENQSYPGTRYLLNIPFFVKSGSSAVNYEVGRWIAQDTEAEEAFDTEAEQSFEDARLPFEELPPSTGSAEPIALPEYSIMFGRMLQQVSGSQGNNLAVACMDGGNARTDARPDSPDTIEVVNRAWMENAAGEYAPPLDAPVSEAVAAMLPNGDGTLRPDPELESDTAYGLPMVVYAGLATCGVDQATRDGMEAIVRYAVGDGQEALPDGNVPLPPEVSEIATRRLADWEKVVEVGTCGEGPPTPTTATTSTTSTVPGGTDPVITDAPYVDPGTTPPSNTGGGGGGGGGTGVVPDSGGGGATPAGGEETAAGVDPATVAAPTVPEAAPEDVLGPVARIVAMAQGSTAVPPMVLLVGGLGLLLVGPVLQTGDALGRAASLPASARRWFRRLRP